MTELGRSEKATEKQPRNRKTPKPPRIREGTGAGAGAGAGSGPIHVPRHISGVKGTAEPEHGLARKRRTRSEPEAVPEAVPDPVRDHACTDTAHTRETPEEKTAPQGNVYTRLSPSPSTIDSREETVCHSTVGPEELRRQTPNNSTKTPIIAPAGVEKTAGMKKHA